MNETLHFQLTASWLAINEVSSAEALLSAAAMHSGSKERDRKLILYYLTAHPLETLPIETASKSVQSSSSSGRLSGCTPLLSAVVFGE